MEERDFLEEYLDICKSIYLRMERDNSWPWVLAAEQSETPTPEKFED
jgi:hypothetical protein